MHIYNFPQNYTVEHLYFFESDDVKYKTLK